MQTRQIESIPTFEFNRWHEVVFLDEDYGWTKTNTTSSLIEPQ